MEPSRTDADALNMAGHHFLAFDLGAASGRAMLGALDDGQLTLSEVLRFPNLPVMFPDGLHWDVLRLWSEIQAALAQVGRKQGLELTGIGIDTWGVDYALLDRRGGLVSNPFHYRDSRTDGMIEEACRRMPRERIFALTGIHFLQLNTLTQLLSAVVRHAPELEIAEHLVMMAGLFNYWLTGEIVCEFSSATTTQCYDPLQREWSPPRSLSEWESRSASFRQSSHPELCWDRSSSLSRAKQVRGTRE